MCTYVLMIRTHVTYTCTLQKLSEVKFLFDMEVDNYMLNICVSGSIEGGSLSSDRKRHLQQKIQY